MIVSILPILDKCLYIFQYISPAKKKEMKVIQLFEKLYLFLKNKGKKNLVFGIIKAIFFIKYFIMTMKIFAIL
jgi:hypothetical protein